MVKRIVIFSFLLIFLLFAVKTIRADELSEIESKLNDLKKALEQSKAATVPLESNLKKLEVNLADLQKKIAGVEVEFAKKEKEIKEGEESLVIQEQILVEKVRSFYKNSFYSSTYLIGLLTGSGDLGEILRVSAYRKSVVDEDKRMITEIVLYIKDLEARKKQLEAEKVRLAKIKEETNSQAQFLKGEIAGAKTYQEKLGQEIAVLSARQQEIISQRLASLNIPRSASTSLRGCSDDRGVDPGFSPRIAFFTFGAPHRNGLNQYGAWGRAKAGQNEEKILQEYYPNMSLKKDYDQGVHITTTTGWSGSIEEYVKRIYEVPDSWTDNNLAVLKAQAVAARTYALKVTENGAKSICTTEQCQVFKNDPKGGNWEQAVNATAGWVLMDGGSPGYTQYASTHGGYILNLGKFDGDGSHNSFSEVQANAYDRESPWFYCDWGARSGYSNTAWLKPSEVADIANVILLARADSSTGDHLYQTDKPHPYGGEVWNEEKVKQELRSHDITPFNNVSDVSIGADFGSGKTTSVSLSGEGKSESFSGDEFKNWFNLRAPANIQIIGPLYNVEKK